jgi:hypothetical protein
MTATSNPVSELENIKQHPEKAVSRNTCLWAVSNILKIQMHFRA